jgi:hypothetical protein
MTSQLPSFELSGTRASAKERREVMRALILAAVNEGRQLEELLVDLKRQVAFDRMSDADKNSFHVAVHDARTIVGGWRLLSTDVRADFVAGTIAPSSAAKLVRSGR